MSSTSDITKRLIYFIGHPDQDKSVLICKICRDYETMSRIYSGEFALRTLLNLYNLHAVRGILNDDNQLIFNTSMSGPHHYFGWIDPRKSYVLSNRLKYIETDDINFNRGYREVIGVSINDFEWINGYLLNNVTKEEYRVGNELIQSLLDENSKDSLFDNPGILIINEQELKIPLLLNPHEYDLSSFNAEIVPNNNPLSFNQTLIEENYHAQHKLRVITYNYGDEYLDKYLMKGSGVFIERHEFIQAITPYNEKCGGFVVLGREKDGALELIAVPIPYGFTLLVNPWAIHGDSTLTGLYMMAMTGNHNAMKTADTVFIKNRQTKKNVVITTKPKMNNVDGISGSDFLLTSDDKNLEQLHIDDSIEKSKIYSTLNLIEKVYWMPVITVIHSWDKTIGSYLPTY